MYENLFFSKFRLIKCLFLQIIQLLFTEARDEICPWDSRPERRLLCLLCEYVSPYRSMRLLFSEKQNTFLLVRPSLPHAPLCLELRNWHELVFVCMHSLVFINSTMDENTGFPSVKLSSMPLSLQLSLKTIRIIANSSCLYSRWTSPNLLQKASITVKRDLTNWHFMTNSSTDV